MNFWDTVKSVWIAIKSYFFQPIIKTFGGIIKYQENDPGTPNLAVIKDIPSLPNPCPPFAVLNFTGKDAPEGTVEHQAAGVYCTMVFSLAYAQSKLEKPIIRWPALTKLIANPRSGKMFNAYYDRYYLNFFYEIDPKTKQTIYTCESTDVVAHELGHAILDSIRPDLWAVQSVEIQAFHEAFGDINAILTGLTFQNTVKNALEETNNDLSKPNVISRLAEQMGLAIMHAKGDTEPEGVVVSLRNAVNNLQYVPPETLPTRVPGDGLAGEPHNFSRVFVGAWYDSFVGIYNAQRSLGVSPEQAVYYARDKMAQITYNGIRYAKVNARFFTSVLKAMLSYDMQHHTNCGAEIRAGFAKHGLVSDGVGMSMAMAEQDGGGSSLQSEAFNLLGGISTETARLSDFVNDDNPLNKYIVELASRREMGVAGMSDEVHELKAAIDAAHHSLKVLHENCRVGEGPTVGKFHNKEFAVIDGRLVRNYYCCGCPKMLD